MAQWQSCFAAKQNLLNFVPINKAGDAMLGRFVTFSSTTSAAGFSLPPGAAPTFPTDGDLWTTTAGIFARINGVTQSLFGVLTTAGGDLSGTYPDPMVVKINGANLGSTTPTGGNLLIGSGTNWVTQSITGDIGLSPGGVTTLVSVLTAGGPIGSATVAPIITWDAKGRLTAVSSATIAPPFSAVTGQATLAQLPSIAANTFLANVSAGTAVPTAATLPSCSTATSAVSYTTNSGFGCNTAITAAAVPVGGITGLGTNVAAALGVNVGTAGAFVVNGGALGTPSSGVATNLTGLPINTGVIGLGTGIAAALGINVGSAGAPVLFNGALGTPSSGVGTNITGVTAASVAVGNVTGLGTGIAAALGVNVGSPGAPVLVNGALGTPSSGTLSNAIGLPVSTGISGLGTGIAAAMAINTGSAGAPVLFNGALGTPSSGSLANATGLPLATGVTGTLAAAQFPALIGDVTNSAGSLTTVVGRVNGVAVTGTPAAGNVIVATGSTAAAWQNFIPITYVTKTSVDALTSANCGNGILLSTNFFTFTIPDPSTLTAKCEVSLTNTDTAPGRGKRLAIFGKTPYNLMAGQSVVLTSTNTVWIESIPGPQRWRPIGVSNLALYVSTTGSTAGDGLGGCAGNPLDDNNTAYNFIIKNLDVNQMDPVAIVSCPGTYTGVNQGVHAASDVGARNGDYGILFTGPLDAVFPSTNPYDGTGTCPNPAAVVRSNPVGANVPLYQPELSYSTIAVGCQTLTSLQAGMPLINPDRGSAVVIAPGVVLGDTNGAAMIAINSGSELRLSAPLTVAGSSGASGYFLINEGTWRSSGFGVTFNNGMGTPNVFLKTVLGLSGGVANFGAFTAPNGVTGIRYDLANSIIRSPTGVYSPTFIPGSTAGTMSGNSSIDDFQNPNFPNIFAGIFGGGSITASPVQVIYAPATAPALALRQNNNIAFGSDFYVSQSNGDSLWCGLNNNIPTCAAAISRAGGFTLGGGTVSTNPGTLGIPKVTTTGGAPGAGTGELKLVCGTNAGTAKLVISAGTSGTDFLIRDNIGGGVTGC